MRLFSSRRKNKEAENAPDDVLGGELAPGVRLQRREGMVTVDMDSFSPESHAEIIEELVHRSGFPLFEGSITHGYSKAFAGTTETCPRCRSTTRQCTANFIYATDVACRVMLAPAGFFCQACPTVIVDERMISTGMKADYRFRRVVGVDHFEKKDPDYFGTWNGEKPIYLLDENEQIMDMVMQSEVREPPPVLRPRDTAKKAKAKRKQAAEAKRRNRRKK